jgi:archaellum biogenesis ATPase FlaH
MNFLKSLKDDYFRMLILGESGSGKSYYLKHYILPTIVSKYTMYYIFTTKTLVDYYKKILTDLKIDSNHVKVFGFDGENILTIPLIIASIGTNIDKNERIEQLPDKQWKYRDSSLFIFDDILNPTVMNNTIFESMFTNFRHLQISVIVIAQISNKSVSTRIRSNTSHLVLFALTSTQADYPIDSIARTITAKYYTLGTKKIKDIAKTLYYEITNKKYGKIKIYNNTIEFDKQDRDSVNKIMPIIE